MRPVAGARKAYSTSSPFGEHTACVNARPSVSASKVFTAPVARKYLPGKTMPWSLGRRWQDWPMPSSRATACVTVWKTRYSQFSSLYGRIRSRTSGPTRAYATSASASDCSGSSTGSRWTPSPRSVVFSVLTVSAPPTVAT